MLDRVLINGESKDLQRHDYEMKLALWQPHLTVVTICRPTHNLLIDRTCLI